MTVAMDIGLGLGYGNRLSRCVFLFPPLAVNVPAMPELPAAQGSYIHQAVQALWL